VALPPRPDHPEASARDGCSPITPNLESAFMSSAACLFGT
jgi:hypothetical protein